MANDVAWIGNVVQGGVLPPVLSYEKNNTGFATPVFSYISPGVYQFVFTGSVNVACGCGGDIRNSAFPPARVDIFAITDALFQIETFDITSPGVGACVSVPADDVLIGNTFFIFKA